MTGIDHGAAQRLDAILTRAATTVPERAAVVFEGVTWTYGEVYDRARRLAGALANLGVSKGDRVALWTTNRAEFLEVFFAVPMLGAIVAPLDYWWNWDEARMALQQLEPQVLIVGAAQATTVANAIREAGAVAGGSTSEVLQPDRPAGAIEILGLGMGIRHVYTLDAPPAGSGFGPYAALIGDATPLPQPTPVAASDPALILFTSGSTGRSKGAVHTHGGLSTTALTMVLELELQDGERTLHFLPLFSSCLEHLLPLTMARATHVVMSHFDAPAVWDVVRNASVTHFDAVPTTLRRLLDSAPASADIPPTLRMISYASERMPDPLIQALIARMPSVQFVQFYGMIEHLCLTVLGATDQLRKIGTVGRPMFGAQLRIRQSPDQTAGADDSSVGEIYASSPTLFAGYWRDDAATAMVVQDHWMKTGDVGRFDADGFLHLEGRVKEIIKTGGFTVIPTEIEGALMAHPAVRDAAVVGVPDEEWGEAVHAFVILAPGANVSESELKTSCREHLASYKCPKRIHLVPELPRTGIGKIARRVVREQVMASGAHQRKES
ncbi:MAG: AMP-binding protein [Gemmatimonadaceae bacterium]